MAIKTRLEDMEIGDKIICRYTAPISGQVGVFSELGTSSATEIPASSSATPDGSFYFIYVGNDFKNRMILVADRNVQHTVSWDDLNSAGVATKDGIEITSLGLNPTRWKTNIRLLTGGTDADKTFISEWDRYIVNGPVGDDSLTWNLSSNLRSVTSTTTIKGSSSKAFRGRYSSSDWTWDASDSITSLNGFRPVLVAEMLGKPLITKSLIYHNKKYKKYVSTIEKEMIKDESYEGEGVLLRIPLYKQASSIEVL